MPTPIETLQMIAARSPSAAAAAVRAVRAARAESPMLSERLLIASEAALSDQDADWTPDERAALSALITADMRVPPARTTLVQTRVTPDERTALELRAVAAGISVSELLRRAIAALLES